MEKRKQVYICPDSKVFVVRLERFLCQSGGKLGDAGRAGASWRGEGNEDQDYFDYGDL